MNPAPDSVLPAASAPAAAATPATLSALSQASIGTFEHFIHVGGVLREDTEGRRVRVGGQRFTVLLRHLTEQEDADMVKLLKLALPPLKPDPKSGEPRHDLFDTKYLQDKQEVERIARAYVLLCGCPLLKEEWQAFRRSTGQADVLTTQKAVLESAVSFLSGKFSADLLEGLRSAIEADGFNEEDAADFFSRPA